jgi:hypothetical protein
LDTKPKNAVLLMEPLAREPVGLLDTITILEKFLEKHLQTTATVVGGGRRARQHVWGSPRDAVTCIDFKALIAQCSHGKNLVFRVRNHSQK